MLAEEGASLQSSNPVNGWGAPPGIKGCLLCTCTSESSPVLFQTWKMDRFCTTRAVFFFCVLLFPDSLTAITPKEQCCEMVAIFFNPLFSFFFFFNFISFTALVTSCLVLFILVWIFPFQTKKRAKEVTVKRSNSKQNHKLRWEWIWPDKLCCMSQPFHAGFMFYKWVSDKKIPVCATHLRRGQEINSVVS